MLRLFGDFGCLNGGREMDKWETVFVRDGYRCVYCGRWLLADFDSWASIHTDHLVPRAQGGKGGVDNLVTSCQTCNMLKRDFKPGIALTPASRTKYLEMIRRHIARRRTEWMADFLRQVAQVTQGTGECLRKAVKQVG